MRRFLLVLLVCAALAGCDGGPDLPAGPVGTWVNAEHSNRYFATLHREQFLIDPTRPAQGDLRITGAVQATPRWLHRLSRRNGRLELELATTAPAETPPDGPPVTLAYRGPNSYYIRVGPGTTSFHYSTPYEPPLFDFDGRRVTVGSVPFDGSAIRVSGSVEFAGRLLPAGVEEELGMKTYPLDRALRYTFEDDGDFRVTHSGSSMSGKWQGTEEGGVRAWAGAVGGAWDEYVFAYDEETDRLMQRWERVGCVLDGSGCFELIERDFLLEEGVIAGTRVVGTTTYERVGR